MFLLSNFLEEASDPLGLASLPYKKVYGFYPYGRKKGNFNSSLNYGFKVGNFEKISIENKPYLIITKKGLKKVENLLPIGLKQKRKWDKKWRILIYDIPETRRINRDSLRKKVYAIGFGKLQKSVYISPFPIENDLMDFLEKNNLKENAIFLISETIYAGGEKKIAEAIWRLTKINEKYKEIIKRIEKLNKKGELEEIKKDFLETLLQDPFLPDDLIEGEWLMEKAYRLLSKRVG